jgi:hypothetical protein
MDVTLLVEAARRGDDLSSEVDSASSSMVELPENTGGYAIFHVYYKQF